MINLPNEEETLIMVIENIRLYIYLCKRHHFKDSIYLFKNNYVSEVFIFISKNESICQNFNVYVLNIFKLKRSNKSESACNMLFCREMNTV